MENQNEAKSVQVTFTTHRKTCPPVTLNGLKIPQTKDVKYLGLHLDRKLEKAHVHRAKTSWNTIEQNVLAARQQIATVDWK